MIYVAIGNGKYLQENWQEIAILKKFIIILEIRYCKHPNRRFFEYTGKPKV